MTLDAGQREFWRRNGYLWLRAFFAPDEVERLRAWTDEIAGWPDTPGKWMRYYERDGAGGKVLARVENYLPYHAGLDGTLQSGRIAALLASLLGEPAVVFKDKINMKAAGGAGFAPHQDAPAYRDFGVDYHVTVMVPIDDFTRENGCLEMAREASQDAVLPQHADGTLRDDQVGRFAWVPLLAAAGDLIVFDSYVPHRSAGNQSAGARRSYYVTYNRLSDGDGRAAYYARKRELFPQECERKPGVDYARVGGQFNLANPFE
jgi:hypothetical protein